MILPISPRTLPALDEFLIRDQAMKERQSSCPSEQGQRKIKIEVALTVVLSHQINLEACHVRAGALALVMSFPRPWEDMDADR